MTSPKNSPRPAQAFDQPLIHPVEKKLLCAIPVASLWAFGLVVFAYLNTHF